MYMTPPTKTPPPNSTSILVCMPYGLKRRLTRAAARREMSKFVREAIEEKLDREAHDLLARVP